MNPQLNGAIFASVVLGLIFVVLIYFISKDIQCVSYSDGQAMVLLDPKKSEVTLDGNNYVIKTENTTHTLPVLGTDIDRNASCREIQR